MQTCGWIQFLIGQYFNTANEILILGLCRVMGLLVPSIKHIPEKKSIHCQALQLVRCLCSEITSLNCHNCYKSRYEIPILQAANLGIHEVVEEIVDSFPNAAWSHNKDKHKIFDIAIINRCEKVFNLIYQMNEHKHYLTTPLVPDKRGNTLLHLAGRLAPPHKLNCVSGAALQMQRELQWFKEVKKFVKPAFKQKKNKANETPQMVFTREHKNLVIQGEKWMKDVASSCTIAGSLIATTGFAAVITVPGGSNGDSGLPILSKEIAFIIFAVSDAVSLFTSTTSVLMFLSILTSRYEEGDFLRVLPKRLIIGLVSLFLSITSMMIAFSATLYLVFSHKKAWILILVAVLAFLPVSSFVSLQFPLLMDLISSTYGRGIFRKQSNRPFY
uniref:Putative alpha-latrocrustotoxin-Lt1a-like isoform X1 n=1 Tax=Davidia involucrata TaxID=16924 RepID=A0A5B6ZIJ6_DAVIN